MILRWGIVGAGEIANRGMAPALSIAADTELAAVQCRTMDKARAFADKHEAAKAYDSLEKMLDDPDLDAVYIATPNSLHAAHTIAAANAGKHVFCEKPMATTVRDAEAMIEACDRNRVKLGVVFQNRYHTAHLKARGYVQSGALGDIDFVTAQICRGFQRGTHWSGWRVDPVMSGSGAIVGQGVHAFDLLRHLLDVEIAEVQAMTDEAPPQMPVEEMSYTLVRFTNGTRGTVVAGTLLPRYDNDVVLYGAQAKLACRATMGVPRANVQAHMTLETDGSNESIAIAGDNSQAARMARMVDDFGKSIREDTEPALSGANGLQLVRIATAVQESSRTHRAVTIE